MSDWIKIPLYVIIGATIIALAQSASTGPGISALANGFAGVIAAMRGNAAPDQRQQAINQYNAFASSNGLARYAGS